MSDPTRVRDSRERLQELRVKHGRIKMPVAKLRCTTCRQYFPRESMIRNGLAGVCSDTCLAGLVDRAKEKRARREKAKERKKNTPRLGGTTRKKVRERDSHVCRWCGRKPYRGEVHHIIYRSQGGKDAMNNLILLCDEHHRQAHSDKKRWQPILLAYIWAYYVEDRRFLIPALDAYVRKNNLHPHPQSYERAEALEEVA